MEQKIFTDAIREQENMDREKEAKKSLKKSLFAMYYADKYAFIDALQFNEKDAVKQFKTKYIHANADGTTTEIETGIRFTVFDLWNDINDAKKTVRKEINKLVSGIADLSAKYAEKDSRKEALDLMKEVYRSLGFADINEKLNATDAKKLLIAVNRMTDNGKADAKNSECKRCLQATLYRVCKGISDTANAREEQKKQREIKKASAKNEK